MAPFFDAGVNKIAWKNQLRVNPGQIDTNNQFPVGRFYTGGRDSGRNAEASAISTGLELQVVLPIVQAPFRHILRL